MTSDKPGHEQVPVPEEERLVRRAQQKDADAWGEIYNCYVDRIYRYVLTRIRNSMVAEDLTEQVFMKALNAISSFHWKGDPFAAWLFRIAHNLIVDFHRKLSSREQPLVDWDPPLSDADPSQIAEEKITMEIVLQMCDKLTPYQRQAIELRFMADLSVEETARIMGKSQGAIKALQHSALAALRRHLSQRGENG